MTAKQIAAMISRVTGQSVTGALVDSTARRLGIRPRRHRRQEPTYIAPDVSRILSGLGHDPDRFVGQGCDSPPSRAVMSHVERQQLLDRARERRAANPFPFFS